MDCFAALAMTVEGLFGTWAPICLTLRRLGGFRRSLFGRGLKLWNESGTNRARIGDSPPMRLRSPQYLAWTLSGGTRSSFGWSDKGRVRDDFLKVGDGVESNQKRSRVNRIPWSSLSCRGH